MVFRQGVTYGIGITTRNRPHLLDLALEHFSAWLPPDACVVVIDDDSTPENAAAAAQVCRDWEANCYPWVRYFHSGRRLGIAGAKNACLWELRQLEAQRIFLFDDDAFPAGPQWWHPWMIDGVHHLTFAMDVAATTRGATRSGHVTLSGEGNNEWQGYTGCLGCVVYLTAHAVDVLGGYDPRFGLYGYEHCQLTERAHRAGLSPAKYCAPVGVMDSVYTLDMHLGWLGQKPPLRPDFDPATFQTSVTPVEAMAHVHFQHLLRDAPTKCTLEDWRR